MISSFVRTLFSGMARLNCHFMSSEARAKAEGRSVPILDMKVFTVAMAELWMASEARRDQRCGTAIGNKELNIYSADMV